MISKRRFLLKKNGEPYSDCYCRHPEFIENYDKAIADDTQIWDVHHRKEEFYSLKELKERGEYYDVSPEELIFLTREEHDRMDSKCRRHSEARKGKKHSDEAKRRIGKAFSKKVLCVETGQVFDSMIDAQRETGINYRHISDVCLGKRKTAGGFQWKYLSNNV